MNLMQIAFSNLKRRKVKMAFMMCGLIVGVATVIAFINIIQAMKLDLGDRIDEFGANAIVLPGTAKGLTLEDIPKMENSEVAEYINIISPKLISPIQSEAHTFLMAGIDFQKEFTQKPWFSIEGADPSMMEIPSNGLILGNLAAKSLNVKAGDSFFIYEKEFVIVGILDEIGSEEDGLVYGQLTTIGTLLGREGEVSMFEISAYCNACPIEEVAEGIEESLPGVRAVPLRQAALFREGTIDEFTTFGAILAVVMLVISILVVQISMLSAVNERTREIGIFRAIGFRRTDVLKIFCYEIGIISFIAGVLGFSLGALIAVFIGPYLGNIQSGVQVDMIQMVPAIALSILIGIIGSIYPVIKATQLDPASAFRA
jgi:putative ABC transport system permease protein